MNRKEIPRDQARDLLRKSLGSPDADFREGQWEAIRALVDEKKRLLVVQRTGWGKSLVYFIATRILRDRGAGPTLIVSPLLALMRNQIEAAGKLGVTALTINSTNRDEWPGLVDAIVGGKADAVLISPERLANDEFVQAVLVPIAARIGLLVIDEVHCISDWGHDFRPDYRRLVDVIKRMPSTVPVLGTTATANDRVLDDVRTQVGDVSVLRGRLMRETLALQTIRLPDQASRLAWLAEHLPELPGTGIVYTLTKRDGEQVAAWLNCNGIEAKAYYSGVEAAEAEDPHEYRRHLEDLLSRNKIKALVATTALGMGYDKPDLGFVVHYQAPSSIIAYYQQVGRAGRAIDLAYGVLLAGAEDEDIHEYFRTKAFPAEDRVDAILELLAENDGLTERQIEESVNLRKGQIDKVLKFLSVESPAPLIKDSGRWRRTPVEYRLDHERIRRLTAQREQEWRETQAYIDSPGCLMKFLAKALDDKAPPDCGKCSRCLGRPVIPENFKHELAVAASQFLRVSDMPLECMKQVAAEAFPTYGLRGNLPTDLRAETGRILSRWGDAGWGHVVAQDKRAGRFRDELATAMAEMILERWMPEPFPTWATCVPSIRHPNLVPDLVRRVAGLLKLPFSPVVTKVRDNAPQKLQHNRFHRCANLDGAFDVAGDLPQGPVLLIDDVIDSSWTMTVVAALLRRAGSGVVWPAALTTASTGD